MTGRIRNARVAGVSIDCDDHRALSEFYARLLGGRVIWTTESAAGVSASGYHLVAQRDARWVVLLDPAGHPFCLTPVVTAAESTP